MPIGSSGSPVFVAGFGGPTPMMDVVIPFSQPSRYTVSGITKDSASVALADCRVEVFETTSRMLRGSVVSDANGAYTLDVTGGEGLTFYVVAYKAGSPDVAGTTVNTLVGANA